MAGRRNMISTFSSLFGFRFNRRITPSNRINNELFIFIQQRHQANGTQNTATSPMLQRCMQPNMRLFFISMVFLFQVNPTFANDSTLLYEKRLEKLRDFSNFLKSRTIDISKKFDFDSSSSIFKFYDTSLSRFFNLTLLKSKYLLNGDNDFETPELEVL